jgi:poly(A) polymerase
MTEREFAIEVVSKLQREGFAALFAGGCVRDELLGLIPADHDVATSATPDQVKALFRRCHSFGASFGVVEVLGPKDLQGEWLKVQVATFRSDGTYTDGRRPDTVTFSSPEEDAARRDFTINGLFYDPVAKQVYDFVGGEKDLRAKVLRAIGDPHLRFTEDKLRILRAVRMAARFELTIDPMTLAAMQEMAPEIRAVSAERIAEEFRKILTNQHRKRGVELLHQVGLFAQVLPEVQAQPALNFPNRETVSFELAFAALLHRIDAKTATKISKRLRFSNDEHEKMTWLVAHRAAITNAASMPNSRLYPILVHPLASELIELTAFDGHPGAASFCTDVRNQVPDERLNPPPLLTGDDLKAMGLKPGPKFKQWLDTIRDLQLDGKLNDRGEAEEKVRKLVRVG